MYCFKRPIFDLKLLFLYFKGKSALQTSELSESESTENGHGFCHCQTFNAISTFYKSLKYVIKEYDYFNWYD